MAPSPLPLLWLSAAFLAGIWLGGQTGGSGWHWAAGAAVCAGMLWLARRMGRGSGWLFAPVPAARMAPLALAAALLLGGARARLADQPLSPADLAWHNGQGPAALTGVVDSPPELRDRGWQITIRAEAWAPADGDQPVEYQPARGRVVVQAGPQSGWRYGDRVELSGPLFTSADGPEFSYRDYLARRGIRSQMAYPEMRLIERGAGSPLLTLVYGLRGRALAFVERVYPAPESALVAGILLGDDSRLPDPIREDFRRTGLAHIVAISGFNISLVSAIFTRQFSRWLGWLRGSLLAALAVLLYALLVGGGAAVMRAAIFGWVGLLGTCIGRRQVGVNSLAFTAAVMCLFQPDWLSDAGFQLSFCATLGLILFAEPLDAGFRRLAGRFLAGRTVDRLAPPLSDYFLTTLAAQIAALPVLILQFGSLSWVSLLANPLALPVQPALMQVGGLSVLAGLVFEPLGQLLAWAAWPFAAYSLRITEWLGQIPHPAWVVGSFSPLLAAGYYAILLSLAFFRERAWRLARGGLRPALLGGAMFSLTLLSWQAALTRPDGLLRLTLLDTGAAEAVLIQTPAGRSVLVNGGPSGRALLAAVDRRAGLFQAGPDGWIVTRSNSQSLAGLTLLAQRSVPGWVLWNANPGASRDAAALSAALDEGGLEPAALTAGTVVDLGSGASLTVIEVSPGGACLEATWQKFRALIAAGLACPADRPANVLIFPSGGLPAALPEPAGLAGLAPRAVLIGSQSPAVLESLSGWPSAVPTRDGWIQVRTDGEQMWLEGE